MNGALSDNVLSQHQQFAFKPFTGAQNTQCIVTEQLILKIILN